MRPYTTLLALHILQLLEKLCSLSGGKPCCQANHAVRLTSILARVAAMAS